MLAISHASMYIHIDYYYLSGDFLKCGLIMLISIIVKILWQITGYEVYLQYLCHSFYSICNFCQKEIYISSWRKNADIMEAMLNVMVIMHVAIT